jgi:hypothetical protein
METRIEPNEIGISNHGMKHRQNQKQTRNHLILHGSRFTHQRQETHGTIPYYWIGKPKSHFGITLVAKAQSRNQLERRNITLENYDNGRSIGQRRTLELTN